jgi:hypothetical protein
MRGHLHGAIVASLVVPAAAAALESIPLHLEDDDPADAWSAAATCSIVYYNICRDVVLYWLAWPGEVFGVSFDGCCGTGHPLSLEFSRHYIQDTSPGHGFAATVEVYAADENLCPTGEPLAAKGPNLGPPGWRSLDWDGLPVPDPFVVTMTVAALYPCYFIIDRPTPTPCGLCYPVSRPNHTFQYGTATTTYCPGVPVGEPCRAQLLWEVGLSCGSVAVEGTSWGQIKALYR